ncbi:YdeI/OmpD-associated family protein [soil metagenome]
MKDVFVEDRVALRGWLAANFGQSEGVWVVFYKGGKRTLSYDDIAEEALYFGWVDSKPGKVDAEKTKLYLSPRNPESNWSGLNKRRIAKLERADLLTEAGRELVRVAKENGSWDALNDVENLVIPEDLARAFTEYGRAEANFQAFPPSAQRGILEWIFNAKRDATRQKRVEETARLAQKNKRANQWPR